MSTHSKIRNRRRKPINLGMLFALGAAGLYLFKLYKANQASKAALLTAPDSTSTAIQENIHVVEGQTVSY